MFMKISMFAIIFFIFQMYTFGVVSGSRYDAFAIPISCAMSFTITAIIFAAISKYKIIFKTLSRTRILRIATLSVICSVFVLFAAILGIVNGKLSGYSLINLRGLYGLGHHLAHGIRSAFYMGIFTMVGLLILPFTINVAISKYLTKTFQDLLSINFFDLFPESKYINRIKWTLIFVTINITGVIAGFILIVRKAIQT